MAQATEQAIGVARVEQLLEQLEALPDVAARETATEVVQVLLELYGEGLERIVDVLAAHDDGTLAGALSEDELVSQLLLLHGLHPVALEERVRGALESTLPYLHSHGGNAELLGVEEGVVRLRLEGSCAGCPSSAVTLKLAIEQAIFKVAPEVQEVRAEDGREVRAADGVAPVEGGVFFAEPATPAPGLIQLEVVKSAGA